MDLNKLYYFHIVAKHQHVTHAAQELYISQPALTKAMKRLEQDLGVPLLYKQRRGIHLTPYGVHLKAQLENVFSVLDHIPGELEQLKQQTANTIKLNVLVSALITTDAIAAYLRSITPEARNVFLCRYYYLDPVKTIAGYFRISESKVKILLHRTRQGLWEHLQKEGFV